MVADHIHRTRPQQNRSGFLQEKAQGRSDFLRRRRHYLTYASPGAVVAAMSWDPTTALGGVGAGSTLDTDFLLRILFRGGGPNQMGELCGEAFRRLGGEHTRKR